MYTLELTDEAHKNLLALRNNPSQIAKYKAVSKALRLLGHDPRHPGLNTHKFTSLVGHIGEEVFEAYAQNNTPGAYRIFWFYGPQKKTITIIAITPHP